MNERRSGRAVMAGAWLAAAIVVAGCTGSGHSPLPSGSGAISQAASTPASPLATPTTSLYVARAGAIVVALGAAVPSGVTATVSACGDNPAATCVGLGSWSFEWDASGRLTSVFDALPYAAPATAISETAARAAAAEVLAELGVTTLGKADSAEYDGAGSYTWRMQWVRTLDAYPVPADGTSVSVTAAGAFEAYSLRETPNAPLPSHLLTKAQALAKAGRCANVAHGPNGFVETCTVGLEWHAPASDVVAGSLLQLCWKIADTYTDNDQNSGGSELWLDAGTGEEVDGAAIS